MYGSPAKCPTARPDAHTSESLPLLYLRDLLQNANQMYTSETPGREMTEPQDLSPANLSYLLAEVGSRQLPLQFSAQEIKWEDCNLPVLGFGKGQLLGACYAVRLPAWLFFSLYNNMMPC